MGPASSPLQAAVAAAASPRSRQSPCSALNPRVLLLRVRTRDEKNKGWQPWRPDGTLWAELPRALCPGQSLLDSESTGTLGCRRLNGPSRSQEPVFHAHARFLPAECRDRVGAVGGRRHLSLVSPPGAGARGRGLGARGSGRASSAAGPGPLPVQSSVWSMGRDGPAIAASPLLLPDCHGHLTWTVPEDDPEESCAPSLPLVQYAFGGSGGQRMLC